MTIRTSSEICTLRCAVGLARSRADEGNQTGSAALPAADRQAVSGDRASTSNGRIGDRPKGQDPPCRGERFYDSNLLAAIDYAPAVRSCRGVALRGAAREFSSETATTATSSAEGHGRPCVVAPRRPPPKKTGLFFFASGFVTALRPCTESRAAFEWMRRQLPR